MTLEYKGHTYKRIMTDDPQVGDLVVFKDKVELEITSETDILQEEVYPMIQNFGCWLYRKYES